MTWHTPSLLSLLAVVPMLAAAAWWGWRLRQRAHRRFLQDDAADTGTTPKPGTTANPMLHGRSAGFRAARAVLFLVGMLLAIVALARPQFGSREELLRKRGLDVVIAIDFSKSMLARDVRPSRIERAVAEIQRFTAELGGDRVGLVAFAGETLQFPITVDYAAANLFLRDLTPNDIPVGGTAIGRALVASQRLLERANQKWEGSPEERPAQVVILLTDGEDHEGEPLKVAQELADQGVRLYTVGIGSRTGEPIPTYADDGTWTGYLRDDDGEPILTALTADNETQLRRMAELTGGEYVRAEQGGVGMDAIRAKMQHLKRTELEARRITVHEERFMLFLLPAFLLLLLEALLPDARMPRKAARMPRKAAREVPGALAILLLVMLPARSAQAWELFRSLNRDVEAGNAALAEGDADKAVEAYGKAARALPDEPGVHLNRGLAWLAADDLAQAREALRLAITSDTEPSLRAQAFYNLGLSFYREGDALAAEEQHAPAKAQFQEAVEAFTESLRLVPGNRNAAWNLELARRRIEEQKQKQEEQEQDEDDTENDSDSDDSDGDSESDPDGSDGDRDQDGSDGDPDQGNPDQDDPDSQDQDDPDQDDADDGSDEDASDEDGSDEDEADGSEPDAQDQTAQDETTDPMLPEDAARALDALQAAEENLEQVRARSRAGSRSPPAKDW